MSDERRAEIEAVARELRAVVRDSFNTPAGRSDEFFRERAAKILDRFRDAHSEDYEADEAMEIHANLARHADLTLGREPSPDR